MSGAQHAVVQVGDHVRFAGGEFSVAGLEGARCRLVDEAGGVQVVLVRIWWRMRTSL